MAYRILFIAGLTFFLIGQILLAQGNAFVYSQEPIDFAHWFLLIGASLLIPQTVSFPNKIFSYLGGPLVIIGIVCIIGMCVLDFLWWSFPTDEARSEFAKHVSSIPSIWKPFISIGPSSKIFNVGLLILSLNYFKGGKLGIAFILFGTLILTHIIPLPYRLVNGYAFTLLGFSMILLKRDKLESTA